MDGEKLDLRPFEERHGFMWQQLMADPAARLNFCAINSEELNRIRAFLQNGQKYTFVYSRKDFIGGAVVSVDAGLAFFGYALLPQWRGKGLARHCVKLIEKLSLDLGASTIRTNVAVDNVASYRVLEQAGYKPFVLLEKNL